MKRQSTSIYAVSSYNTTSSSFLKKLPSPQHTKSTSSLVRPSLVKMQPSSTYTRQPERTLRKRKSQVLDHQGTLNEQSSQKMSNSPKNQGRVSPQKTKVHFIKLGTLPVSQKCSFAEKMALLGEKKPKVQRQETKPSSNFLDLDDLEPATDMIVKDKETFEQSESDRYQRDIYESRLRFIDPQLSRVNSEDFQKYFHAGERLQQYQTLYDTRANFYSRVYQSMQDLQLMPRKQSLMGNSPSVNASQLFGSSSYISMFSEGVASNSHKSLKSLKLANNQLTSTKFNLLVKSVPLSVNELDLRQNNIGMEGVQRIIEFSKQKHTQLKVLNLENNLLGNEAVALLLSELTENRFITRLNLSRNRITDKPMETLAKLLRRSSSLFELYLHFNHITSVGGSTIFKAMQKNQYLKVLDLSFNKIGSGNQAKDSLQSLVVVITKPHPELVHLDLSNNSYGSNDAKAIANALDQNNIIYGFHFEGNNQDWMVDQKGFLVNQPSNIIKFRRINSCDLSSEQNGTICWICDGWQEVKFTFPPGLLESDKIFIHIESENYQPIPMEMEDDVYVVYRMCPSKQRVKYFFSSPGIITYLSNQKFCQSGDLKLQKGLTVTYPNGLIAQFPRIKVTNYIQVPFKNPIVDISRHYTITVNCKPREKVNIVDVKADKWMFSNL